MHPIARYISESMSMQKREFEWISEGWKNHSNKYKLEMLGWVKHQRIEGLATSGVA